jgi:hypothetical protein
VKVRTKSIRVDELHVDPDAQRALRPAWRDQIAREFDRTKLGIIHVTPNGDGYKTMDGQHRTEAMRKLGLAHERVLCLVYEGLSRQEQATIFLGINNSKQVRTYDKFRVRITQGEPVAVDIARIVDSVGLYIFDQKSDGAVRAVSQLENIYTGRTLKLKDGPYPEHLAWSLSILKDAWGYDANAFDAPILEGMGALILRFGDRIDRARLATKLASFPGGPRGVLGKGRMLKDIKGITLKNGIAEVLADAYNNQLRSNALPAWDRA